MQNYYFQIRHLAANPSDLIFWELIPACIAKFEDPDAASDFAAELAQRFINVEIRLTDNKELIGGKYF